MEANGKSRLAARVVALALILCFGSVVAALVGAWGSGNGAWHFRTGFKILEYAVYAAGLGLVLALVGAILARRVRPRFALLSLLALVVAGGFLGFVLNQVRIARSVPAIHDISTNLDDPPSFSRLTLRADNLENIPDMGRDDLAALPPLDRWKAIHREHYGDIATIRLPWPVAETVRRAEALARERGWEVAAADPQSGRLEAVDTTFFFRFRDDVVLRVRPAGSGSIVDMRSVSRVGVSDVGVNARRVRGFLADLRAGAGA